MPASLTLIPAMILVVDDDRSYRAFLSACLRARGHDVRAVDGAAAALRSWDAAGRFDLVLTDLQMPGLDGLALRDELRRRAADACVVVISAGAERHPDVLPKPYAAEAVIELAEMTLAAHRPARPPARALEAPAEVPRFDAPIADHAARGPAAWSSRGRMLVTAGARGEKQRTRWPPKSR